mgnify:CR=1 FL=1
MTELTKLKLDDLVACPNIAELLDADDLHKIGYDVVHEFETDLMSRSAWEKKTEDAMKLALQVVESKTFPWPNASNVKFPLVTIAALQYHARSYPVLVDGDLPVKCRVLGEDKDGTKRLRADRVQEHMSYQLLEEDEDWESEMDKVLKSRKQDWPGRDAFLHRIFPRSAAGGNPEDMVLIDGSVLANAPFRPAIDALRNRPARREVDRRFVVLAALRALAQRRFNLASVQGTTHPTGPMLLVNGPIRAQLGINCASGVFGQGFRANATIGRAVRLVLMNIGQGLPGKTDMATHGTPCKFSFCAGENEEASPWEPLHVERGLSATDSAVTVHAGEAPHNIQDHGSRTADELLLTIADTMNITGNNNAGLCGEMLLVLGPEHAAILAAAGMSKEDVRQELHRRLRLSFSRVGKGLHGFYRGRRGAFNLGPEVTEVPYFDDARQILIAVAGGAGLHSMVVPSFGGESLSVTERIT